MLETRQCVASQCPIQYTLDLIGSKWAIPILRELFVDVRRTHELLEALPGISSKTLMIRLRELEEHGLVARKVYAEIPPRVEYSLTAKGQEIQHVLTALYQVGKHWLQREDCDCPLQNQS